MAFRCTEQACTEHERYPTKRIRFLQSFCLTNWPNNVMGINSVCLPFCTASVCPFVSIPVDNLVGALLRCLTRFDLICPGAALGCGWDGIGGRFRRR